MFGSKLAKTFSVVLLLGAAGLSRADTITAGNWHLNENQSNQAITIQVSGSTQIAGADLYLQIADGLSGPLIQSIDLTSGTIFQGNAGAPTGTALPDYVAGASVITSSGTVTDSGTLATVYFDTTGVADGTYDLLIKDVMGIDTDLSLDNSIPSDYLANLSLVNGTIQIGPTSVPIPSVAAMATVLLAGLLLLSKSRRHSASRGCTA